MLAEEKAASEKLSAERDAAEREARQNETKVISLTHELEELQDKLSETDKMKKTQQVKKYWLCLIWSGDRYVITVGIFFQMELEALMESKDDFGKNVSSMK